MYIIQTCRICTGTARLFSCIPRQLRAGTFSKHRSDRLYRCSNFRYDTFPSLYPYLNAILTIPLEDTCIEKNRVLKKILSVL